MTLKLAKKIIDHCNEIANKERTNQRQSYVFKSTQLFLGTYTLKHPRRRKKAKKAEQKAKTVIGRLIRGPEREPSRDRLFVSQTELGLFKKVFTQKRRDKNKVYSLH